MAWIETISRDTKMNSDTIGRIYFQTRRSKVFEGNQLFEQDLEKYSNTEEAVNEIKIIRLDIRVSSGDVDSIIFSADITGKCTEYALNKSSQKFRQKDGEENEYHYWKHWRSFVTSHAYPMQLVLGNKLISEILSVLSIAKKEEVVNFFTSFKEKDIDLLTTVQSLEDGFNTLEIDPQWEKERIKFLKKKEWL
jgi:hypothetical protein